MPCPTGADFQLKIWPVWAGPQTAKEKKNDSRMRWKLMYLWKHCLVGCLWQRLDFVYPRGPIQDLCICAGHLLTGSTGSKSSAPHCPCGSFATVRHLQAARVALLRHSGSCCSNVVLCWHWAQALLRAVLFSHELATFALQCSSFSSCPRALRRNQREILSELGGWQWWVTVEQCGFFPSSSFSCRQCRQVQPSL